jgi:chromosome segregation ATPase
VPVVSPPWVIRAEMIKSEFSVNSDLQRQVENLNEEVISLIRELKTREQAIQVSQVKIEIMESRAKESGQKSGDSVDKIKAEMQVEQERYEGIITQLSGELAEFEREVEDLKASSMNAPRMRSSPRKSIDAHHHGNMNGSPRSLVISPQPLENGEYEERTFASNAYYEEEV